MNYCNLEHDIVSIYPYNGENIHEILCRLASQLDKNSKILDSLMNIGVDKIIAQIIDEKIKDGTIKDICDQAIIDAIMKIFVRYYPNVDAMKQDEKLIEGMTCITQGYYQANDGGHAKYLIKTNKDNDTSIQLKNNKFANLIHVDDTINALSIGAKGDGIFDNTQVFNNAFTTSKELFIPNGIYKLSGKMYLNKGNILKGENRKKTILYFNGTIQDNSIFDLKSNTGLKNLTIKFSDTYNGNVVNINPNETGQIYGSYYTLHDVDITFKYKSAQGTAFRIYVTNDNGKNDASFLFAHFYNCTFNNGNKGIFIEVKQGQNTNQSWITSSRFKNFILNDMTQPIFINSTNTNTTKPLLDINDLLFDNIEIQTKEAGFYVGPGAMETLPITVTQTSSVQPQELTTKAIFNNLTIWDSPSGILGKLKNTDLRFTNFYASNEKNNDNYIHGFNEPVKIDGDGFKVYQLGNNNLIASNKTDKGGIYNFNPANNDKWYKGIYTEFSTKDDATIEEVDVLKVKQLDASKTELGSITFNGRKLIQQDGQQSDIGDIKSDYLWKDGSQHALIRTGSLHLKYNDGLGNNDNGVHLLNGAYIFSKIYTLQIKPNKENTSLRQQIGADFEYTPFVIGAVPTYEDTEAPSKDSIIIKACRAENKNEFTINLLTDKKSAYNAQIRITFLGYKS